MTKTKIISVHTMKGGVGKTTMTILLASYLAYEKGLRVLVFDLDQGQSSLSDHRAEELTAMQALLAKSPSSTTNPYRELLKKNLPTAIEQRLSFNAGRAIGGFYSIVQETPRRFAEHSIVDGEYDYILVDMGGRIHEPEQAVIARCDAILVPMTTQTLDYKAGLKYGHIVRNMHHGGHLKENLNLVFFWQRFENWYINTILMLEKEFNEKTFGSIFKGYLKNRLRQAPSAFDKQRMLTTISSPFVMETEAKRIELTGFFDELLVAIHAA